MEGCDVEARLTWERQMIEREKKRKKMKQGLRKSKDRNKQNQQIREERKGKKDV